MTNFILEIQFEQFLIKNMSSKVESVNKNTKSLSFSDFTYLGRFLLKFIFLQWNESDLRPHCIFYIAVANVLFCMITQFAQVLSNLINEIHFVGSILGLWYCIVMSLAVIKSCEIVMRKREFKQFLAEMNEIFPKILKVNGEFNLRQNLKEFTIFMQLCVFMYIILSFAFTMINLMKLESKVVNEIHWQIDFIYPMLLPFDPYQHGIFELIQIVQQSATYFTLCAIMASDTLLYCLINYFCIHYDYLAGKMSQIETSDTETEQQMIVHIVEEHKTYNM